MGCPFEAGDVVVCVDNRRHGLPAFKASWKPERGAFYRVEWCIPSHSARGVWSTRLTVDGEPKGCGWPHFFFRKIDADATEDFRHTMRSLKPRIPVSA